MVWVSLASWCCHIAAEAETHTAKDKLVLTLAIIQVLDTGEDALLK